MKGDPRRRSWPLLVTLLVCVFLAPPSVAQTCGADRVEEISPGLIYKVTSLAWSPDPAVAGSNIYVFKRSAGPGGIPRIVVFGMGNGNGTGEGSEDFFAYTGRVPMSEAEDDVDSVLAVVTAADCFDLPLSPTEPVAGHFLIQHAHLDHANQEFVDEVKGTDLAPVSFRYHIADHQLLTCEGTFQGQVLEDGANCGFDFEGPSEENPFRGHPFELPIVLADWDPLGSALDQSCTTGIATFVLADGRGARVERDIAHTPGGMNIVVDPFGGDPGLAFLSSTSAASCGYPGFLTFVPHQ